VHYSLLPAFSGFIGSKPVKEALNYGSKLIGVTIHMVDESLDGGRPLMQVTIPVKSSDEVDGLMDLHFRCGCLSLGSVMRSILVADKRFNNQNEEAIKIKERMCLFSNKINLPFDFQSETFWHSLKI
jgi:phosphoribosylglycinamide formyltransferase-1